MKQSPHIQRRTFLKGLGTAMALPLFESLVPARAMAQSAAAGAHPLRMAVLFVPNGVNMADWTPDREGADFKLPYILEPLAPFQRELLVLTGLTQDKGRANGDGPGDHARSAAAFLTGAQPLKSEGSEIRAAVSADQVVARAIGRQTRFPSLELAAERGSQAGKCDSGYSCAYSNSISWRDETSPMVNEVSPRAVFERLFANDLPQEITANQARRLLYRKSILDFVLEDANRLSKRVNGRDKQKLDEYLTAVREIEQRIEFTESQAAHQRGIFAQYGRPEADPGDYREHLRLLGDMMVLAFQTDMTRVCTFMLANEGSNRPYRDIGVSDGHHTLSHHEGKQEKKEQIAKINHFHVEQFGYILNRLKSIPEGDGTLLDNCMILYGAGISDGNRHNNENLPLVLAGRGGGTLLTGRHIRYPYETPMCNLLLSMIDRMGSSPERFGDSTGRLRGLEA